MRNALRHIPTGQSATQRLQSWPSSLPSIYNPFHLPSAHPWPNLGPTPSSRNIFFARHPFVTLLTRDHPNLDDLLRDIWETRLNAFVDILLTPSFPSSFQRFPFPSSSRTCYPFNRHLCYAWLLRCVGCLASICTRCEGFLGRLSSAKRGSRVGEIGGGAVWEDWSDRS